ncbi:restriction endonuclease subunit R [Synechococcus sp. R55.6]|jgi:hypothetical protein|uniref:restriction endonuclease subunit R n=1 Tax=unclassified Synechococcus TaxID=2626047 RepID=UPI0039C2C50D
MTAVQTRPANTLTLREVHELLGLCRGDSLEFEEKLDLPPLTEREIEELTQLQELYFSYLADDTLNEGQVKFLFVSPLLKLAGFLSSDIKINLEENIADIIVEEEEGQVAIKGRVDLLAIRRGARESFWILVIETKGGTVATSLAIAQLLTYAYKGIKNQEFVWGLATNGEDYQFILLQQGSPITYHYLPKLGLLDSKSIHRLLQVLKSIRLTL